MQTSFHILSSPSRCAYLPEETWRLEYVHAVDLSETEYSLFLLKGWRRFGRDIFRPRCPSCTACQSLRIPVDRFQPDRSQRRNRQRNQGPINRIVGEPFVDEERLELFQRYHAHQAAQIGWRHRTDSAESYHDSFVDNPFPTEEWLYYLEGKLVGIGYVDALPVGLSAIYFVHDPEQRDRGLGIWNVLSLIDETRRRGLPHLYLGYYVPQCRSLAYKAGFKPTQVMVGDGKWLDLGERVGSNQTRPTNE